MVIQIDDLPMCRPHDEEVHIFGDVQVSWCRECGAIKWPWDERWRKPERQMTDDELNERGREG